MAQIWPKVTLEITQFFSQTKPLVTLKSSPNGNESHNPVTLQLGPKLRRSIGAEVTVSFSREEREREMIFRLDDSILGNGWGCCVRRPITSC